MKLTFDLRRSPGKNPTAFALQTAWIGQCIKALPEWEFSLLITRGDEDKVAPAVPGIQVLSANSPIWPFWANRVHWPKMLRSGKTEALLSFAPTTIRGFKNRFELTTDRLAQLPGKPDLGEKTSFSAWELETLRETFTQGKPYFLYFPDNRDEADLSLALKAFSIFKKWNQSSYKLVMVMDNVGQKAHKVRFQSYKYREDVELIEDDASLEREKWIAGALALILDPQAPGYVFLAALAADQAVPLLAPVPVSFPMAFVETNTRNETALGDALNRTYANEGRMRIHSPVTPETTVSYWEGFRKLIEDSIG